MLSFFSDMKGKSRHPSAPSALLQHSPSSSPALQRVLITGRAAHTLPCTNNPADKSQESPQGRRSTLPARAAPSAFTPVSPATSGEWIRSSESSLGSSEQLNPSNVATTVACTVVTPPTSRTSGSCLLGCLCKEECEQHDQWWGHAARQERRRGNVGEELMCWWVPTLTLHIWKERKQHRV